MSVQNNIGYKPVKLGVELPNGEVKILTPHGRKALRAEVDALAKRHAFNAKELRQKLFAVIKEKGMDFPSDHTQAEIDQRKLRSAEAADIHNFVVKNFFDGDVEKVKLENFNTYLANLKVGIGEDSDNKAILDLTQNKDQTVTEAHIKAYRKLRKEGGERENELKDSIKRNRQDAKDRRRALIKKRRYRKVKPKAWAQTRPAGFAGKQVKGVNRTKKSGTHIVAKGVALSLETNGLCKTRRQAKPNRGTSTSISCRKAKGLAKATKPLTKAAFLLSAGGGEKHWRKVEKQEAARKRRAKYRKNGKSRSSRAAAINGGSGESAKQNNPAYEGNC